MAERPKLSFGVRFPPAEGPESTARLAREAEEGGFEWVWAVDTPLAAGPILDPYVDLVSAALATKKVMLGPNVSPLFLRSPVATAAAILSLDRISNGRAVLGLGTGGSALVTLGVRTKIDGNYGTGAADRRKMLEEQVEFYRKLFRGEGVSLGTREMRIAEPRPIKIYVAASGPKALELAGRIADGAILHVGVHIPTLKWCIEQVYKGAREAGRDPKSIDICVYTGTAIDPEGNRKADIKLIKPFSSSMYSLLPKMVEMAGFKIAQRQPERMPYPDMTHALNWEEAMEIAETYIPDEIPENFCLVGPPDEAIKKIEQMFEVGVTQFYLRGHYTYALPHKLVKTFNELIIPHFKKKWAAEEKAAKEAAARAKATGKPA